MDQEYVKLAVKIETLQRLLLEHTLHLDDVHCDNPAAKKIITGSTT